MSLLIERTSFPLTEELTRQGAFSGKPVIIADVGASGGVARYWRAFGPDWRGYGFEPLVQECARLSGKADANVQYIPAFVTAPSTQDSSGAKPLITDLGYFRSSSVRAQELQRINYVRDVFNAGAEVQYANERLTLDGFFEQLGEPPAFIKIDTDGHDFEVLQGAANLLESASLLGVLVEAPFHGDLRGEHVNVFANIDRFLRARGLVLFDLTTWRYSRACLPSKFVYEIPAQTERGQVLWGDALYFRDYGHPDAERLLGKAPQDNDLLKLACLFEIFSLDDCAAELLEKYRARLGNALGVDAGLDLVTPTVDGRRISYREFQRFFEEDPRHFYPSSSFVVGDLDSYEGLLASLRREVADLRAKLASVSTSIQADRGSPKPRWCAKFRAVVEGVARRVLRRSW